VFLSRLGLSLRPRTGRFGLRRQGCEVDIGPGGADQPREQADLSSDAKVSLTGDYNVVIVGDHYGPAEPSLRRGTNCAAPSARHVVVSSPTATAGGASPPLDCRGWPTGDASPRIFRIWAVERCKGIGRHTGQRLVADGRKGARPTETFRGRFTHFVPSVPALTIELGCTRCVA
jgi:hypothetical protein